MSKGIDWRKFPRLECKIEVRLQLDSHPVKVKTVTHNIGSGGVCIFIEQSVEKLEQLSLNLFIEDGQPPIVCSGRVVWKIEKRIFGNTKPTFDVGIEFVDLSDNDAHRLTHFLSVAKK